MKRAELATCFVLASCASLPGSHEIVEACESYLTVRAVVQLAVLWRPSLAPSVDKITAQVDPICRVVLAGQAGSESAVWVRAKTIELEELERSVHLANTF